MKTPGLPPASRALMPSHVATWDGCDTQTTLISPGGIGSQFGIQSGKHIIRRRRFGHEQRGVIPFGNSEKLCPVVLLDSQKMRKCRQVFAASQRDIFPQPVNVYLGKQLDILSIARFLFIARTRARREFRGCFGSILECLG